MDIKFIQQLADLMEDKNLSSLTIEENDSKISIAREMPSSAVAQAPVSLVAPAPQPVAQASAELAAAQASVATGEALTSPIVGIGYVAPSPDALPFVAVGDKVKKGQTLCIIEAMKVMNEFNAPRDGEITEVCFEDGQLVEFNQCLFRLK